MLDLRITRFATLACAVATAVSAMALSCAVPVSAQGSDVHRLQNSGLRQAISARRLAHRPTGHETHAERLRADPDRDGLRTAIELRRTKTLPRKYDTDGDSYGDGTEVAAGSDPLDPASTPETVANRGQPESTSQRPAAPPTFPFPGYPIPPEEQAPPEEQGPSEEEPGPPPPEEQGPSEEEPGPPPPEEQGPSEEESSPPEEPGPSEEASPPEEETNPPPPTPACTQTVAGDLSQAIASAPPGAVLCLNGANGSFKLSQVNKTDVTLEGPGTLGYSTLTNSSGINLDGLHFTDGFELLGSTHDVSLTDNEFTGRFGVRANGDKALHGTYVSDIALERNYLHDLDFTGAEGTANGYGMTLVNGVQHFTILRNTIKSVAIDYIQLGHPSNFVIAHNTFLGPSLRGSHPAVHQDLLQVFGGGENIVFRDNVASDTGTNESLLFQEGAFSEVTIENNLLMNDSDGYSCQIYQVEGLTFRYNTIVNSHWGCLFRDLSSAPPGSGYRVDHNIVVGTEENRDFGIAGRAGTWGSYDWNVSGDDSAPGGHSIHAWQPSWASESSFDPLGLPFIAGFLPTF